MFKGLSHVCLILLASGSIAVAQEPINSFDARVEGVGVYSDDLINNTPAMIKTGTPVRLILSAQTANVWTDFCAPFAFYSPDNSISEVTHTMNVVYTDEWNAVAFGISGGPITSYSSWDGTLPDSIVQAAFGVPGLGTGWSSPTPSDVITFSFLFPEGQSGTFCIDTIFFPPAGTWLLGPVGPAEWGGSVGGYADGGFCVTVFDEYPDCCEVAGDADHDGRVIISDVNAIINRIFFAARHPVCCREMDANGDGSITIQDALYIIGYIHLSGLAPVCGPSGMSCGG